MSIQSARQKKNVALYIGWGPVKSHRNPGDLFCYQAACKLLEKASNVELFDIRKSHSPVIEPWLGHCVIGGGTVLPHMFNQEKAPGLSYCKANYIFGSGCLSPEECKSNNINVNTDVGRSFIPIGIRGPLSAKWFKNIYNIDISWIGIWPFTLPKNIQL